jgi:hypothetical protein
MKDPYKVLKVDKTATKAEIKKAYRKKAQKTHPDKGGTDEAFAEVNWAHTLLIDDDRRAHYDNTGSDKGNQSEREQAIYQNIYAIFQMIFAEERDKIVHVDIVTRIKIILEQSNQKHRQGLIDIAHVIGVMNILIERLDTKKGKNVLKRMLELEVLGLENKRQGVSEQIQLNEESIEVLKNYKFSPVPKPEESNNMDKYRVIFQMGNATFSGRGATIFGSNI